jgi:hypothetical protein
MEGSRAPPTEPGSIALSYFVSTDGSGVQLPVLSVSMESVFIEIGDEIGYLVEKSCLKLGGGFRD